MRLPEDNEQAPALAVPGAARRLRARSASASLAGPQGGGGDEAASSSHSLRSAAIGSTLIGVAGREPRGETGRRPAAPQRHLDGRRL
jgi:hypothetical protein